MIIFAFFGELSSQIRNNITIKLLWILECSVHSGIHLHRFASWLVRWRQWHAWVAHALLLRQEFPLILILIHNIVVIPLTILGLSVNWREYIFLAVKIILRACRRAWKELIAGAAKMSTICSFLHQVWGLTLRILVPLAHWSLHSFYIIGSRAPIECVILLREALLPGQMVLVEIHLFLIYTSIHFNNLFIYFIFMNFFESNTNF